MALPAAAALAQWAAKKAAAKAASKAASSPHAKWIALAAVGLAAMIVFSIVSSMLTVLGGVVGAMGGLSAGAAGATAANECLATQSDPSAEALSDIPPVALEAYQDASLSSGVDWVYLAAVGKVETDHGRHGGSHLNSEGDTQPPIVNEINASGPMQFMPATWAAYGRDGDFDGDEDVQNIFDAALGAAYYLKASGAPGDMRKALFAYNQSTAYVDQVMAQAEDYRGAAVASDGGGSTSTSGGTAPPSQVGPDEVRLVQANIKVTMSRDSFLADRARVVDKAPDFITYNEVKSRSLDDLAPAGYAAYRGTATPDARNNAVAWRTDRWKAGERGSVLAHESNLKWATRYLNWVTLTHQKNGRVVSVIVGHALPFPKTKPRMALYAKFTETVNALTQQLASEGQVLLGGDMNVHFPTDQKEQKPIFPYKGFKASNLYSTYQLLGTYFPTGDHYGGTIDYIFTQKDRGLKALRHGQFELLSDHNAIWADFRFDGEGGPTGPQALTVVTRMPTAASPDTGGEGGGGNGWTMPMRPGTYTLTARYGQVGSMWSSGYHTGLDFAAATGTAVFASAPGTVISRPDQASWAGVNFLTIDHGTVDGDNVVTWYAHMSRKTVSAGKVVGGAKIGEVGELGNVTGPHLHFEVRVNGVDVDPLTWLAGAGIPDVTGTSGDGCGPTGTSGVVGGDGSWGGYQNGQIPLDAMCKLNFDPAYLECNAAKALEELNVDYRQRFGKSVGPVGGYRSYAAQVQCQQEKGDLCATPGTSNHGWGLAADLSGGGINTFGTAQHQWMRNNAGRYGWVLPDWAQQGGSKPEPWHWEFTGTGNTGSRT